MTAKSLGQEENVGLMMKTFFLYKRMIFLKRYALQKFFDAIFPKYYFTEVQFLG